MLDLKPTDKVYLKQRYYSNGNVWYQGTYKFGELPQAIRTEQYIDVGDRAPVPGSFNDAIKKVKITIDGTKPIMEQVSYGEPKKTLVDKGKPKEIPLTKIEVNSANAEELSKLANVTTAIATKMIEAREKEPFANLDNLKERIKLNRGNWDDHQDRLLFEKKKA